MAWFSRNVSLGNFPDFSEAVNKLSESVKNIEKNFDSALGLEEKSDDAAGGGSGSEASGLWPSATDRKGLFEPIIGFMGQKGGEGTVESLGKSSSSEPTSPVKEKQTENDDAANKESEQIPDGEQAREELKDANVETETREEIKESDGEGTVESFGKPHSSEPRSPPVREEQVENDNLANQEREQNPNVELASEELKHTNVEIETGEQANDELKDATVETETEEEIEAISGEPIVVGVGDKFEAELDLPSVAVEITEQKNEEAEQTEPTNNLKEDERSQEIVPTSSESVQPESAHNFPEEERLEEMHSTHLESLQPESTSPVGQIEVATPVPTEGDATSDEKNAEFEDGKEVFPAQAMDVSPEDPSEIKQSPALESPEKTGDTGNAEDNSSDRLPILQHNDIETSKEALDLVTPPIDTLSKPIEMIEHSEKDIDAKECLSSGTNMPDIAESMAELEKMKKEMKMMETALQGAARQAQAKADEIAKLMNENEQLKSVIDDLRKKTNEAKIESLREEYHQRVAAIERKVYALTRERDTLRREQNKKSDATALLKEKDEIITQVMAEGEKLSKKQAAQESQIRKLRAQIRELEEEKKALLTKVQAEESKVDSMKRDKAATEKLLQETVEKHQAEVATQKEYYSHALNEAKEAQAVAEARANTEARTEMESRLREAEDRESILVQTLEELRQTLSRKEQQAVFREDMLRRDIEDLQRRYQASERRCEELITQVPDSTRPLLRQIEAMQETAARRAEAWNDVERSLNSRLQEAEARAAASEEKERSINERLTQTLSRINVLEAQISCLRAEQTQLTRSLEKERQRAAENRQEYLALKEEADTHESRVSQLEEEIREHRRKHKEELHKALAHQELLQKELEREKTTRLDQERASSLQSPRILDHGSITRQKSSAFENGSLARKISSASSLSNMEESYFLQSTLGSSDNLSERRSAAEGPMSPYYIRSMTSNTYEAALRQKEGELSSYASRLASLESIRDSLAEELVKMTAECEKLRSGVSTLPGIRAELEALRRRHSAALELMGERDEELEELRADIVDLKEMYREQVNVLVNKVQILSSSMGAV